MRESEWQNTVIQAAKLYGWRVKIDRNVRVQRADGSCYYSTAIGADGIGYPDLTLVRGNVGIAAELKVGRNKPTPAQDEWLLALKDIRLTSHLWYPEDWDKIEKLLRRPV